MNRSGILTPPLAVAMAALLLPVAASHSAAPVPGTTLLQSGGSRDSGTALCAPAVPDGPLSIEQAIDIALCNHPRIRQSWASVMERGADLGVARAAYFPTLDLSSDVDARRRTTDVDDSPLYSSRVESVDRGASANSRLVLFDFGRRSAASRRAAYLIRAAELNRDVTTLQVCLDTASAYFDGIQMLARVVAAENAEQRAVTSLNIARERQEAGAGTIADVVTAEAALARVQLQKGRVALELKLATSRLAVAMGLSAGEVLHLPDGAEGQPRGLPFASLKELLELADLDSPGIRAARESYLAAQVAVRAAKAERKPTISLGVNADVGATDMSSGNDFSPNDIPSDSTRDTYGARLTISVPLFNGFRTTHQIRQAKAREEQARWAVEEARLRTSQAVNQAFETAGSEVKNVELSTKLVDLTDQALEAALERYRTGAGSLADVILAQNAADDAERDRIGAMARLRGAKLNLALSLGRMENWAFD